jgi:hypothetical protein
MYCGTGFWIRKLSAADLGWGVSITTALPTKRQSRNCTRRSLKKNLYATKEMYPRKEGGGAALIWALPFHLVVAGAGGDGGALLHPRRQLDDPAAEQS